MLDFYSPDFVQSLGQQRAMAGRRLALHAHQGDHVRVGRELVEQRLWVEVGQYIAFIGRDESRAQFHSLASGDFSRFVGRCLFLARGIRGRKVASMQVTNAHFGQPALQALAVGEGVVVAAHRSFAASKLCKC